jgi:hypothetical protein
MHAAPLYKGPTFTNSLWVLPFVILFCTAKTARPILTIHTSYGAFSSKDMPLGNHNTSASLRRVISQIPLYGRAGNMDFQLKCRDEYLKTMQPAWAIRTVHNTMHCTAIKFRCIHYTAALIHLFRTITALLETNSYWPNYVIVYALHLSKAFDSVRHTAVLDEYFHLKLPDDICNTITRTAPSLQTIEVFEFPNIMASIIQKSIALMVLRHKSSQPPTSILQLQPASQWTSMLEIVFVSPRSRQADVIPLPAAAGFARVELIQILGVTISMQDIFRRAAGRRITGEMCPCRHRHTVRTLRHQARHLACRASCCFPC